MASAYKPTAQQDAIIDAFMDGEHMVVQAGAGTGKTTTLKMLAESTDDIGLYIAFNRSVAQEAKGKFPGTVDAMTAHSLAMRMLRSDDYWGDVISTKFSPSSISNKALYDLVIYSLYPHEGDNYFALNEALKIATGIKSRHYLYYTNWAQLVSATVKKFCQSADDEIAVHHYNPADAARSINKHRMDEVMKELLGNTKIRDMTIRLSQAYWERILDIENKKITFSFDHVLKVWQLSKPVLDYDYILFDEAQDANATLSHVLMNQPDETQLVVVGDQNQAIYGFTGSLDAMKKFQHKMEESSEEGTATVLPLNESWRFGEPIAEAANQVLRTKNVEDRITGLGADTEPLIENFGSIDFVEKGVNAVLCRSNNGCLESALWVMEHYPQLRIYLSVKLNEMKEFYEAASNFQQTGKTKYPVMKDYRSYIEFIQAVEEDPELQGEFGLLLRISSNMGGNDKALVAIERVEASTVSAERADVTISTVHQAKGSEWDNVLLHDDWSGGLHSDEEKNLLYVGTTRAKKQLFTGGFWPVYRFGIPVLQNRLEYVSKKLFSNDDDSASHPADDTPTLIITKEDCTLPDGRQGCFDFTVTHDPESNRWTGVKNEDIRAVRVHGMDAVHRGAYVPAHTSITLDSSFFEMKREAIDTAYTDVNEKVIAHVSMDALEALRESGREVTLEQFASAVSIIKVMIRDNDGKVATMLENINSANGEDQARVTLCAAILYFLSNSGISVATSGLGDLASAANNLTEEARGTTRSYKSYDELLEEELAEQASNVIPFPARRTGS